MGLCRPKAGKPRLIHGNERRGGSSARSLLFIRGGARAEGELLPAASAPAMGRNCPSPQRAPGWAGWAWKRGDKAARNAASTSGRLREQLPFRPEGPPDPRPLPSPGRGRSGGAFGASGEAAAPLPAVRGCCGSTRPLCLGGSLVAPDDPAAASGAHGGSESMAAAAAAERSFAQMGLDARILQAGRPGGREAGREAGRDSGPARRWC